ncbi:MAG: RNA-guided pseudouridylation complex pseudouridine synthase subunit Cbf5 [Thermoplasmata archaeon]|nr:RNA-guided pseudouridylation complex pseudouridine synthase subunit Cbf5 [Candidatus Sysuiplasma acidicola]
MSEHPTTAGGGYGIGLQERSMEEMLDTSIIIIDKPAGPTSHQVSAWVAKMLGVEKAGHAGTLDPSVTGVLPVALGRAARALDAMNYLRKSYIGIIRFHGDISRKQLDEILPRFTGRIFQVPPVRSAVKRERRIREIHALTVMEQMERLFLFNLECQSGTYVRTLCRDIGLAMCTGSQMEELRRTRSGPFGEDMAIPLQKLQDAVHYWKSGDASMLRSIMVPYEKLLQSFPAVELKDSAVDSICHGANLTVRGVNRVERGIKRGAIISLFSMKGEGVAMARALMSSENIENAASGVACDTLRVFMKPGTYPRFRKT